MFGKRKAAMLVGELLGTGILTFVVLSVKSSQVGISYFVALGAGLAIATLTYVIGTASGAHLNPALTFGLWTARKIKTLPAIVYSAVQLLGGAGAYWLYTYLFNTHLPNAAGHFDARVLVAEAFGTFVFVWGWAAAAARRVENSQFAVIAGSAFAIGMIIASFAVASNMGKAPSDGVINPAIALGMHSWNWGTYVLGPVIGAVVAANVQSLLFTERAVAARPSVASASTSSSSTTKSTSTKKSNKKNKK